QGGEEESSGLRPVGTRHCGALGTCLREALRQGRQRALPSSVPPVLAGRLFTQVLLPHRSTNLSVLFSGKKGAQLKQRATHGSEALESKLLPAAVTFTLSKIEVVSFELFQELTPKPR